MSNWIMGPTRALIRELRAPGNAYGQSGKLPRPLTLNKTDLIRDVRALPPGHNLTWKIGGNPASTGRYANDRRHVIIWLGQ